MWALAAEARTVMVKSLENILRESDESKSYRTKKGSNVAVVCIVVKTKVNAVKTGL